MTTDTAPYVLISAVTCALGIGLGLLLAEAPPPPTAYPSAVRVLLHEQEIQCIDTLHTDTQGLYFAASRLLEFRHPSISFAVQPGRRCVAP